MTATEQTKPIRVWSVAFPDRKKSFNQWVDKIHRHVKRSRY